MGTSGTGKCIFLYDQEKPVSGRTVKQVTDNLLGTRSTSTGSRPWRYLLVALGIILILCILWLSPIGKHITTPPMIPATRESLIARLKGLVPSWAQVKPPDKDPIATPPRNPETHPKGRQIHHRLSQHPTTNRQMWTRNRRYSHPTMCYGMGHNLKLPHKSLRTRAPGSL